jgi:hypothetical protein
MNGYQRLTRHLLTRNEPELILTFDEIEEISERNLPKIANDPQYWSNLRDPRIRHPPNRAARKAGYFTCLVKREKKVRFTQQQGDDNDSMS